MTTPHEWYTARVAATESKLADTRGRINRTSLLRILFFLALLTVLFWLYDAPRWQLTAGIGCTLLPFLMLVKRHNRLFASKEWLEAELRLNRSELKALQGDCSDFDGGADLADPQHPYTFDLDVFGARSLFQTVNRTCTPVGRRILAGWMRRHLTDKAEIEKRQESIRDMARQTEFREQFRVTGRVYGSKTSDEEEIRRWSESPSPLLRSVWVKLAIWGVPAVNAVLLAGGIAGVWPTRWFGISFMTFVIISFAIIKRATLVQQTYGEKLKTLNSYARLIALAKRTGWTSAEIRQWTDALNLDGKSPAEALGELTRELDRLDLRNNQLLYVVLEGSMFFQLRQIVRIERWKERYGRYLTQWLDTVGRLDALCSLATFAYNRPEYTYPEIADEPFRFMAADMGHPLMPAEQCVKNDATIPTRPYFLIITGANMAGKSTYLRTIGINYLLACIGCPVCCRSLSLYPARLVTSLRTSDSLAENESYFFAELKRLKRVIDWLEEGKELFIILDEILKGTNSADKQKGSFDLIRQFMRMNANGIIATHDLLLGTLAEHFPERIRNYRFEADITGDELTFSYRLREGVAQNMNACFLMRKMGITVEE